MCFILKIWLSQTIDIFLKGPKRSITILGCGKLESPQLMWSHFQFTPLSFIHQTHWPLLHQATFPNNYTNIHVERMAWPTKGKSNTCGVHLPKIQACQVVDAPFIPISGLHLFPQKSVIRVQTDKRWLINLIFYA